MANIAEFARNIKSAVVARTPLSRETRLSLQDIHESKVAPETRIIDVLSHHRGNCLTEIKLAEESNKSEQQNYRYVQQLIDQGSLERRVRNKDGVIFEQICLTDNFNSMRKAIPRTGELFSQ